jgi:hypothetical protein
MSTGSGQIERAIENIFTREPDNAFTVRELCSRVYFGVNRIERKHYASVCRAVRTMIKHGSTIGTYQIYGQGSLSIVNKGNPVIVYNRINVMSYAMARLKDLYCPLNRPYTEDELRAELGQGGNYHDWVVEGGWWWLETQLAIAKRRGDTERMKELEAEIRHLCATVLGSRRVGLRHNQDP